MKLGRRSRPSNKISRPKSRAQANVAGYEKRLARKANKSNKSITDLYEHVQVPEKKSHRSKVTLDLGSDEEFEGRDGEEGDDDDERERLKARLIGENEDDEKFDSDDDEEVDSDAAFEESDEERFEEFFSRKVHEEDAELSDQDSSSDPGSASEEENLDFDPSDDEEMPEAVDILDDFVSNLDVTSTKRKATEDLNEVGASTDTRARKRQLVMERTEAGAENEFRTRSSGLKLNLDDLLSPLESQSSALQSLKTSTKALGSSSSKAKTLSAPLPQRTQERLDREAAYEETKEEVDKWSETMNHIRMAEHLSFPLQSQSTGRVSNLELTAKFKPTTALESSVDALLKSAGLKDEDIHRTEEAMLEMNQFSVEEVAQRRGELRKTRELMFRADVKARRVGKIKNVTFTTRPLVASDTSSETLKSADLLSPPPPSPIPNQQHSFLLPTSSIRESNPNPWLTRISEPTVKLTKKANEVVVQKSSKTLDKSKNKLKKHARKREKEVSLAIVQVQTDEDDSSDSNSEVEAQEAALTLKGKGKATGIKAFEQQDLVAVAFAGDNVVQNFEEAKSREIASDAPREVDTTIPGWGSWGGVGIRKLPPKPQRIKKVAGIDPTTRADFNKKHIIISEKRDKKAGKYLVKDLPYPYTSKAQFERAMENPLGAEWNTRVAFQRGTLPKVVKKPGVIINPLEKLTSCS